MPVNLPQRQSADPRLLALLSHLAAMNGRICLAEGEFAVLERQYYFRDAERRGLVHIDEGGEWSMDTVVSITREGRQMIGEPRAAGLWKRLELAFRRHPA